MITITTTTAHTGINALYARFFTYFLHHFSKWDNLRTHSPMKIVNKLVEDDRCNFYWNFLEELSSKSSSEIGLNFIFTFSFPKMGMQSFNFAVELNVDDFTKVSNVYNFAVFFFLNNNFFPFFSITKNGFSLQLLHKIESSLHFIIIIWIMNTGQVNEGYS